ncbi:MAG: polymer-forming cytoskeletal protein [Culturomica sp.]|jgi:cytoskeletal protein CcmA (bactofilin family)|nr:polymer-forming cytoskeletal protein [Culturomica sp.]
MAKEITNTNVVNLLSEGTVIVGDIKSKNNIRVDGIIKGKIITSGKLVVGNTATVEGDIECANIDVFGIIHGNITASESVALKTQGKLIGNIITPEVSIETGVIFNGSCKMNKKEVKPSLSNIASDTSK